MKKIIPLLALFGMLSGCAVSVFNAPVTVSTKSFADRTKIAPIQKVSASRCTYIAVLPFPFKPGDLYEDLLKEADKAGGNAVVDMRVQSKNMTIFGFVGADCWEATGQAVKIQ